MSLEENKFFSVKLNECLIYKILYFDFKVIHNQDDSSFSLL